MATKKKRPLSEAELKKKRSKAAKKGWETRRRNTVKKAASNNQRKLTNAQRALKKAPKKKANSRISLVDKTRKELEALVRKQEAELREQEAKIERLMRTENWVDAVDPEYLSRDGHIALQASNARHDPDYFDIRRRLDLAYAEGEDAFDMECYDVAAEYDYEVREVYTLFYSP
jgi:chromosome segregation ATPase